MTIANYLKNYNQSIVHVFEASKHYWHGWVDIQYVSRILTMSKDSLCCCLSPLSKKKWQWNLAQLHPTQFCHSLQQHPCQMQPLFSRHKASSVPLYRRKCIKKMHLSCQHINLFLITINSKTDRQSRKSNKTVLLALFQIWTNLCELGLTFE
jgi:hypothetical protein